MNRFSVACDLCEAVVKTAWLYSDKQLWVAVCADLRCALPMIVVRRHVMVLTVNELTHVLDIAKKLFGGKAKLRLNQRKIRDHWHCHVVSVPKERIARLAGDFERRH